MPNDYRFVDGGAAFVGSSWQTVFTVDNQFDAAAITSCLVANRSATVSGQDVRVDVAVYNSGGVLQRYWANRVLIPQGIAVSALDGTQNLQPDWTIRAQGSVSGAIDVSVSAIGVIYGA